MPTPPFTFLQVKGHQADLHANKGETKWQQGCNNPEILQILQFIIILLITAFKITVLSQSPDLVAMKSGKDQQSCSFTQAGLSESHENIFKRSIV